MNPGRGSRMGGKELKIASKLFHARKFGELTRLLEPQVFRFRESFIFFYLLGVSCLYTGDFGGAYSYLKRAVQLDPENTDALLALAATHLRRRENNDAILTYLKVLEHDKNNRKARSGLDLIRTTPEPNDLYEFVHSKRFTSLFPGTGFHFPGLLPISIVAVILFAGALIFTFIRDDFDFSLRSAERVELEDVSISKDEELVSTSGNFRYVLTEKEITKTFDSIKDAFNDYDDNRAQMEINRILNSNASQNIKDKVAYIQSFLGEPDFTTFKTNFSYAEVSGDPFLYENCYVMWKGKVSNLIIDTETIRFDLLVGYEKQKVLQGIVPVFLSFAEKIDPDQPVELIGKVVIGNTFQLEGKSIHLLSIQ